MKTHSTCDGCANRVQHFMCALHGLEGTIPNAHGKQLRPSETADDTPIAVPLPPKTYQRIPRLTSHVLSPSLWHLMKFYEFAYPAQLCDLRACAVRRWQQENCSAHTTGANHHPWRNGFATVQANLGEGVKRGTVARRLQPPRNVAGTGAVVLVVAKVMTCLAPSAGPAMRSDRSRVTVRVDMGKHSHLPSQRKRRGSRRKSHRRTSVLTRKAVALSRGPPRGTSYRRKIPHQQAPKKDGERRLSDESIMTG